MELELVARVGWTIGGLVEQLAQALAASARRTLAKKRFCLPLDADSFREHFGDPFLGGQPRLARVLGHFAEEFFW